MRTHHYYSHALTIYSLSTHHILSTHCLLTMSASPLRCTDGTLHYTYVAESTEDGVKTSTILGHGQKKTTLSGIILNKGDPKLDNPHQTTLTLTFTRARTRTPNPNPNPTQVTSSSTSS